MRGLPVRRIASTAVCATVVPLVLGFAAPTAVAAGAAHERGAAAAGAPVPGADALLARAENLGGPGAVLEPVTDLVTTALEADDGRITADRAKQLSDAIDAATAKITAADSAPPADRKAAADPVDDALAALEVQVAALLAAVTSGDADQVLPAATGVVTGLAALLAAALDAAGLPLPSLADQPVSAPEPSVSTPSLPLWTPVGPTGNLLPAP
ncbi:hypothetical protein [Streptomyces sp. NPDC002588]|uniref:hypothetical protein n=1 Tax=Streptomyces sp. NPDC002588 TaxID=3154419 RepID=UPI0033195EA3